jgi:hypothetical protein
MKRSFIIGAAIDNKVAYRFVRSTYEKIKDFKQAINIYLPLATVFHHEAETFDSTAYETENDLVAAITNSLFESADNCFLLFPVTSKD